MGTSESNILVVGIASSAGGLSPLIELVEKAICHENMAFILVPHLSRDFETALPDIMRRISNLKIEVIRHNMDIEKCHLYILPPGSYAEVMEGKLILLPRPSSGINLSANVLFRSLAQHYKQNAIGVVLSGADVGADGSEGVIAIKENGGHTYAQDPWSAEYPGMPKAAIQTGKIDSIMTPEEIGNELTLVSWAR